MAKTPKPEKRKVDIGRHRVVTYSYGDSDEILFLLNGGPGIPCDYLRDPLLPLAEAGYRIVTYDQLGTGASDKPKDKSLWTIGRYVEEVETVRRSLDLGKIHLLGHSWGGWLSIEYALTHQNALKSLILSNTCGDMPHLVGELNRHREALGHETVAMMQRFEAVGNYEHPAYKAAITILNYRHVFRNDVWPKTVRDAFKKINMDIYGTMQGPNEFLYIGNLKEWNRIPDMHRVEVPTLVMCGEHDELTPACSMRMHNALPDSEITVFPNCSHMAMYEDPDAYRARLIAFLDKQKAGGRARRKA
jgi:proline iminopeptidase